MSSTNEATQKQQNENENDDLITSSFWLTVDEETSRELSNLLESFDSSSPPPLKVRFTDDPYSPSIVFQSSSSFVTINGNEESCGSSFSDSESSVMASFDLCGGAWGINAAKVREWLEASDADVEADVEWKEFLNDDVCVEGVDEWCKEFVVVGEKIEKGGN